MGDARRGELLRDRIRAAVSRLRHAGAFVTGHLRSAWSRRAVRLAAAAVALALLIPAAMLLYHV